ncbi:MAG: hypothetical protein KAV87_21535 [Desulfobacteraceae bacterium]|nr:hypothetical protein [Desulfobacteraceae bacterium]
MKTKSNRKQRGERPLIREIVLPFKVEMTRDLPARAFLPATLSLARRAGQCQAGPSRSGHDRIHAIVYTFSNQYTILPALMNDTKELRSVFVEAIREDS